MMQEIDQEWLNDNFSAIFDDFVQLCRSLPRETAAPLCAASNIIAINRILHSHENYTTEAWKIAIRAELKNEIESYIRAFIMNSGDKNDETTGG